jgi:DNA-binding response OmpR family regulator
MMDLANIKVLLVDDERDITDLLEDVLRKDGFHRIEKAHRGLDALPKCREFLPDVIILDIMLPDLDGIEVCKRIRQFSFCPILFLSAKNDEVDKILGLASGGDDYVTKPFSPREIVFRIKAQLRRRYYEQTGSATTKSELSIGKIRIDTGACRVYKNGAEIGLTAREYQLLLYLAENVNIIVSKERLYEQVWGENGFACDNTIMVHIRHIREKIEGDPANPKIIVTVKGLGYKLVKSGG